MSGEKFIENLERINKRRVAEHPKQADDGEIVAATANNAPAADNDAVVLDLSPKK